MLVKLTTTSSHVLWLEIEFIIQNDGAANTATGLYVVGGLYSIQYIFAKILCLSFPTT